MTSEGLEFGDSMAQNGGCQPPRGILPHSDMDPPTSPALKEAVCLY